MGAFLFDEGEEVGDAAAIPMLSDYLPLSFSSRFGLRARFSFL